MYSSFADQFSATRYKKWASVEKFLEGTEGKVLELGSGNGKNLVGIEDRSLGVDICPELVQIARSKGIKTLTMDVLEFPIGAKYETVLCIAVIHHFRSATDRMRLLQKIKDLTRGKALITTWRPAKCEDGDNNVPFQGHTRYYYKYPEGEFLEDCVKVFGKDNIRFWEECENDVVEYRP